MPTITAKKTGGNSYDNHRFRPNHFTTYLSALWYALKNDPFHVNKLKLGKIGSDAKYLADLSKIWMDVNPLERTKSGEESKNIRIDVSDELENVFEIRFPDLSGEIFQSQYDRREISKELFDYINGSNGILVFINAKDIEDINEENKDESQHDRKEIVERHPSIHDPVQVQIVEHLQFIQEISNMKIFNLGIIISAWDIVESLKLEQNPEDFLKSRMNMLWQFLYTNKNYKTKFWGVSAQGGELSDSTLLDKPPAERIIVVNSIGEEGHDITLPIFEVLGENNAR